MILNANPQSNEENGIKNGEYAPQAGIAGTRIMKEEGRERKKKRARSREGWIRPGKLRRLG